MLVVQDLATSEETDSMNLQPGQETSDSDANPGNSFLHFFKKNVFPYRFFFLNIPNFFWFTFWDLMYILFLIFGGFLGGGLRFEIYK